MTDRRGGGVVVSAAWLAERLDRVDASTGADDGSDDRSRVDGDDRSGVDGKGDGGGGRDGGDLVVVDVRDAWEYDGIGHLPGAVSIPFDAFRSEDGDEGMLPGAEAWADLLSDAGIGSDDTLVAYDDTNGVFAARLLVTALAYGHPLDRLHLLDGDYSAWTRAYPVTTDVPGRPATTYEPGPPVDDPFVGYDDVAAVVASGAVDDGEAVILDTREPDEWAAGHLPGAVQLDWRELVDEGTRGLRPDDELETVLADHGVTPGTRVVLYCNTARRISHTYLVLRHLGYDDVGFYEGSLAEWTARDGPVATADGDGD
jgi:thiosulfate/3-mercaptopyruvate sulfurtransferase